MYTKVWLCLLRQKGSHRKHGYGTNIYEKGIRMNLIAKMNLNNAAERVLHVPGNYTGGILEMTLVID